MKSLNPFDLLKDNDTDDPALLIAALPQKVEPSSKPAAPEKETSLQKKPTPQTRLPSKPLPSPFEAVGEANFESARGGRGSGRGYGRGRAGGGGPYRDSSNNENSYERGRGGGFYRDSSNNESSIERGRGAGGGGSYRDSSNNESSYRNREISAGQGAPDELGSGKPHERRGGPRGSFRGDRRGGFGNGEGELNFPRRTFERRSGTGQGNEIKREGAGRGNWGTQDDDIAQMTEEVVNEDQTTLDVEKPSGEEVGAAVVDKEAAAKEVEEDKEMTLVEYEKLLEEKRKALMTPKTEERKVDAKEFESMQPLSNKKTNDDIFIKLGSEKDKKKELTEKEERAKKSLSINEFLKPAEGERFYPGGRGRGRGSRGGYNARPPPIQDLGQFPTLGGSR